MQPVLIQFGVDPEQIVLCVDSTTLEVPDIDAQAVVPLTSQAVDQLVPCPELSVVVPETVFVVNPLPGEAESTVHSALDHRPSGSVDHLAVDVVQLGRSVWANLVDAARVVTALVDIVAVCDTNKIWLTGVWVIEYLVISAS